MVINEEKSINPNKYHFYTLDFLKFLFAIIIACHHFQQGTGTHFSHFNFYYGRIRFTYCVELFFMISGLLLAISQENRKLKEIKQFMLEKVVRLLPMSALSVLAMLVITFFWTIQGKTTMPGIWKIANSLTCTFYGGSIRVSGDMGVNNPLWYICVLFICYGLFFSIKNLVQRKRIDERYFYLLMIFIGCGVHYWKIELPFLNDGTSRGYASFFLGMFLWQIIKKEEKSLFVVSTIISILIGLCLLLNIGLDDQWGIFTFLCWPSLIVFVINLEQIISFKYLSSFLVFLGGVSFEIYIWHLPMRNLYMLFLGFPNKYTAIEMILFIVLTICFSIPLYLFVELRIRKWFSQYCYIKGKSNEKI